MSLLFDRLINFLKWPVAIYAIASMPALIKGFSYFNLLSLKNSCFVGGALLFFGFKSVFDREFKSTLQTFGHELTHAFFAIITFHKVTNINLDDEGGQMSFVGKGNWLIVVAPYFFPLFLFFSIVVLSLYNNYFPDNFLTRSYYPLFVSFALGVLMGAHLDMIGSQVHDNQTDLKILGTPFCLMFIIPANICVFGTIFAFNSKGYQGVFTYFELLWSLNKNYFGLIF